MTVAELIAELQQKLDEGMPPDTRACIATRYGDFIISRAAWFCESLVIHHGDESVWEPEGTTQK